MNPDHSSVIIDFVLMNLFSQPLVYSKSSKADDFGSHTISKSICYVKNSSFDAF